MLENVTVLARSNYKSELAMLEALLSKQHVYEYSYWHIQVAVLLFKHVSLEIGWQKILEI